MIARSPIAPRPRAKRGSFRLCRAGILSGLLALGAAMPLQAQRTYIRVSVSGLLSTATAFGSAIVTRTDVAGQTPTAVTLTSSSARVDVAAGTYEVRFTPPSGYALASYEQGVESVTLRSGRHGQATFYVVAQAPPPPPPTEPEPVPTQPAPIDTTTQTVTPTGTLADILNNGSFETDWSGFRNGSGLAPSGAIVRSSVRARDGSYAVGVAWDRNATDLSSQIFYDIGSGRTHLWVRAWFYVATAWPNGAGFKFFRFQDAGYGKVTGIQTLNGQLAILTADGRATYAGPLPAVDMWHYVEWEFDTANRVIRVWVDGAIRTLRIYYDPYGVMALRDNGTALYYGTADVPAPRYLDLLRVINPTTNTGAVYFDRVAVSSVGRLGP